MTKEERVVKMEFDNKQFEEGVKTSISSLNKLDEALDLEDASKNISKLKGLGNDFNLDGIASAADTISSRFSNMGIAGMTALQNITNAAISTGKNMLQSLTIDPMKTGFAEYETKMGSVQTILSNTRDKGTDLEDVNEVLNRLNTYSDKTIYNFSEMVRNIGTFTAAGIELDTSASAIEGIANLAAASGSSSMQASTAMYQLSQALSAGKVGLQDWNSVVNAGMGGQLFQKALQDTAREHGIAVDDMIAKNGSFRESLKEGWINADVLTETLNKFTVEGAQNYSKAMMDAGKWTQAEADALVAQAKDMESAAQDVKTFTQLVDTLKESAQSGWSQTWEIILGDFTQAKDLFTAINNAISPIITSSADARNKLLTTWADMGGRDDIIEALTNAFGSLKKIVTSVKEAIREVFPPITADKLYKITKSVKDFSEHLKITDETAGKIKSTVKGGLSIVSWIPKALGGIIKMAKPLLGVFGKIGNIVLSLTGDFGNFISETSEYISTSFNLESIMTKLSDTFEKYKPIIEEFGDKARESFTKFGGSFKTNVTNFIQNIPGWVSKAWDSLKRFISDSKNGMIDFGHSVADGIKNVITSIKNFITGFKEGITDIGKGIDIPFITKPLQVIIDKVKNLNWEEVLNFGKVGFIGILIKKIFSNDASSAISDIVPSIKEAIESLTSVFDSVEKKNSSESIKTIAKSIAILAGSMFLISRIDSDKLLSSGSAMAVIMLGLVKSVKSTSLLSKNIGDIASTLAVFKTLSRSILVASIAMKILGSLSWPQIIAGATAIATTIGIMLGAAKIASKNELSMDNMSGSLIKVGISSMFYAFALRKMLEAMTDVITTLGAIKTGELVQGIISLGSIMVMLGGFIAISSKFVSDSSSLKELSKSILLISVGFRILSGAISILGNLELTNLAKGLGSVLIMLSAFGILANYGKVKDNMLSLSVAMVIISTAMIVLAGAVKLFSMMDIKEIALGIGSITAAIVLIGSAMKLMSGSISGAIALTIVAAAVNLFVPAIVTLGNLKLKVIGTALLSLAGVFGVLGASALILSPLAPVILTLSASLLMIASSVAVVGAGLSLIGISIASIAAGLATLAGLGSAGALIVITTIETFLTGLIKLIPTIVSAIGEGIKLMLETIISLEPVFVELLNSIIEAIASVIISSSGIIFEALGVFLTELLLFLTTMIDPFLEFVGVFINSILTYMSDNLPGFLDNVIGLLVAVIQGTADAIGNNQEALSDAIYNLISSLLDFLGSLIEGGIDLVKEKAKDLMESGFIQGIRDKLAAAKAAVTNFVSECKRKITDKINEFKQAGKDLLQGFIDGISEKASGVIQSVTEMANNAVRAAKQILDINSPSKVFYKIAEFVGDGFILGLKSMGNKIVDTTNAIGKGAIDAANKSAENINDSYSNIFNTDPIITPNVDMSIANAAAQHLHNLFNSGFNTKLSQEIDSNINDSMFRTRSELDDQNGISTNTYNSSDTYENTFVINDANDPEKVAREVDTILQQRMEKRRHVWR